MIEKALRRAFSLGQTYWQQADSESYSQNKKSEDTYLKFQSLVAETIEQQPDSKPACNHCLQIRHKDCEEWLANLPDGIFATDTWTIARIVWNAALSSKPSAQVPEEKEIPDLLNSYDDMGGYWDIGYAEGWNDCRQAMLNQFSQENKSQEG